MPKIEIFICYSHNDNREAEIFRRILTECFGLNVFMADFSLIQSKDWYRDIISHLESCEIFVPVISENILNSSFANQEIGYAIKKNLTILPLRIDATGPHDMLDHTEGFKTCRSREEIDILKAATELSLLFLTHPAFSSFKSRSIESIVEAIEKCSNFRATSGIVYTLERSNGSIRFNGNQIRRIKEASVSNPYISQSTIYFPRLKAYLKKYYSVVL